MQSCALMNGQHRQVGPLPQPSQAAPNLTHDAMRNQLAGTANNSYQYQAVNLGVQLPQSAHFVSQNGIYFNRQTSNWQPPAGPHQVVSSGNKCQKKSNSPYLEMLLTNPSTNMQMLFAQCFLPTSHGLQDATQDFHRNATQSQPSKMTVNTTYNHVNTPPSQWKQLGAVNERISMRIQNGQVVPHLQSSNVWKGCYKNANGDLINPGSQHATLHYTACGRTLVSATAHERQTAQAAHNHIRRQNSPQFGFSPSIRQASYNCCTSQPCGNNSIPTHSSSRTQMLHATQLSSACNNGEDSSNANSRSQYKTKHTLPKTNELPLNPTVTHQQMLRHNISADGSHRSYTAGYDSAPPPYTSTPNNYQKFAGNAEMTNTQPVPSAVSTSCNLNNTQSFSLHSGQSLPTSSQSFWPRLERFVNAQSQQNSVPDVVCLSSKASVNNFNNTASKGNPVGSLSGASQLMQQPEGILPQRNKPQSSVANSQELLEIKSSAKQNESSVDSSSGHSGTRAVAVVQPLPMKSCQNASTASNATTGESLWNPEKVFVSSDVAKNGNGLTTESNLYAENPSHSQSNKFDTSCLAASNDGALLSKSHLGNQNLMQKSALDNNIAKIAEKSVHSKVPVSQHCSEDQGETVKPPTPPVLELSSLPTMQWTADALMKLVEKIEKAQMQPEDFTEVNLICKIVQLFWDSNCKTLISQLRLRWYQGLMVDVVEFLSTHINSDTVLLSQVRCGIGERLTKYHLLKHDEVYSELPYKSSWLNLNEQIDDIDKEFGFPETLTRTLHKLESDNQTYQETVGSIPEPVESEVPDKVLFPTELKPVDSGEEKQASTVETTSTQTASSNEIESVSSSDPQYSFHIQVLPPEEAKHFFKQVQPEMPQSMDTDCQTEKVINSSVQSKTREDTVSILSVLENEACDPIEQVCCIARLMEIYSGESTPSLKCQCMEQQNDNKCTNETLDKEEEAVPKDDSLFENSSCRIFDLTMEDKNPEKDKENTDGQIITLGSSELCSDVIEIFDLTDDKGKANSSIFKISSSSQSSIVSISDDENEDLPNTENEIPSQMAKLAVELSEPEGKCEQELLKSTGTMQSSTSVCDDKQTESTESEVPIQMSDNKKDCAQAKLKSADMVESLLQTKGLNQTSATANVQMSSSRCTELETAERKRKRLSSNDTLSLFLKKSKFSVDRGSEHAFKGVSRCERNLVKAAEAQPLTSDVSTVELVLFGSAQQEKCAVIGARNRHVSFPEGLSNDAQRPPEVLSVNLGPLRRKSSDGVRTEKQSFKEWLCEKWRRSLPPAIFQHKNKLKKRKCSSASVSEVRLKRENCEMRALNSKSRLSLKRKTSLPNGLKVGKVKEPKQPDDHERSNANSGSNKITPLQENTTLKFCVLPNTFNFKDGSKKRKESADPASDKPDHAKEKSQHSSKTLTKTKGVWYPKPEKRYRPVCPSAVTNTSNLFHEFQKKYIEKTQSSTD